MGNSVEHISQAIIAYFSVTLTDAQRAGHYGGIASPVFSKEKQRGRS